MLLYGGSEREYQKGDEIAWYADGDKIVRNEYNPATAYAFGTILCTFESFRDFDSAGCEKFCALFWE